MSAREWKPGDVAEYDNTRIFRTEDSTGARWVDADGDERFGPALRTARPLVVIDPEDREQVERLAIAYTLRHNYAGKPWEDREQHNRDLVIDSLADALREFANPKPPKPDEPRGLGAVVEDAEGLRWVRTGVEPYPWASTGQTESGTCFTDARKFSDIDAVRVLSEGLTP